MDEIWTYAGKKEKQVRHNVDAVDDAFGVDVDYAMLVKFYSNLRQADTRYSPGEIV